MNRSKLPKEVARLKRLIRSPRVDELILLDMRRDYSLWRKKYFGNSIPPVEAIMFGRTSIPVMEKMTSKGCYGFYLRSPFDDIAMINIVVSEDCDSALRGSTILHEMAHIKVDLKFGREMGHGKHWQNEMKRLARLGAFRDMW